MDMAAKTQRGIRVHKEQWEAAAEICERMNTNLSAVINQLIAQIIIQERIPFSLYANKQEEEILLPESGEEEALHEDVPHIGTPLIETDDEAEDDGFIPEETDVNLDWASLDVFGTHQKKKKGALT